METRNGWGEWLQTPRLVLATRQDDLNFKPDRTWFKLEHQTAGIACHHPGPFFCLELTPKPEVLPKMFLLEKRYYDSSIGWATSLQEYVEYRDYMKGLFGPNISVETTFSSLEEAIYPIDVTAESIKDLTDDQLPEDLDDLVEWGENPGFKKFCGCMGRWKLFIITENSD